MSVVVFAVGNPSRGDDALGPLLMDWLAEQARPGVHLVSDFQLQIEHALDLEGHQLALFIDAGTGTPAPFEFRETGPAATLEQANALILKDNQTSHFVSTFYAVLDPAAGRLARRRRLGQPGADSVAAQPAPRRERNLPAEPGRAGGRDRAGAGRDVRPPAGAVPCR